MMSWKEKLTPYNTLGLLFVFSIVFTFLIWLAGPLIQPWYDTLLPDSGAEWYIDISEDATGSFNPKDTLVLTWTEVDAGAPNGFLTYSTSYVIKTTATTGFYYELVVATPSA